MQAVWNFLQNILGRFRNPSGDSDQADDTNVNDLDVRKTHGRLSHVCVAMFEIQIRLLRDGEVAVHVEVLMAEAW